MMCRKALLAAAVGMLAATSAQADTFDWGVHDVPRERTFVGKDAPGSFTDFFTFTLPSTYNNTSSAVSLDLVMGFETLEHIHGGYTLWRGTPDAPIGGSQIGGAWSFGNWSGTSSNMHTVTNLAPGSYFFKVDGWATGTEGGTYTIKSAIAPVPEPGTYGMMLAGLAVVGFVARRRRAD